MNPTQPGGAAAKRGTVANFREHVHRRGEHGVLQGYESVFELDGQPVRLMLTEPAPINDGDDVEVEGRRDEHYLLAQRYINHSRSIQGTGKRWMTGQQRALLTCLPIGLIVLLSLCLFGFIALILTSMAGS